MVGFLKSPLTPLYARKVVPLYTREVIPPFCKGGLGGI